MSQRDWDVPKRDLLDIERTAQADKVTAADHLADIAEAALLAIDPNNSYRAALRQAVQAYRIACGEDTGDA